MKFFRVSVGLKIPIILENFQFLWICEIFGNSWKMDILPITALIKVRIWRFFCTHVTHITVINFYPANFVSTKSIFSYKQISLLNFAFFSAKLDSVTQRLVSQENAFKKSKHLSPFLHETIESYNSVTLIKQFHFFFKIAKFEFNLTVHYGLWAKWLHLSPLKDLTQWRMP